MMKIFLTSILFLLASCSTPAKNDWVTAYGKYGQTWINGNILMEITYKSAQDCLENVNYELNNNPDMQRLLLIEKTLSVFCDANGATKEKISTKMALAGLRSGGLTYEGFFRLATSAEKYSAWFPDKKICEIISSDLKSKNKNQDLVCP